MSGVAETHVREALPDDYRKAQTCDCHYYFPHVPWLVVPLVFCPLLRFGVKYLETLVITINNSIQKPRFFLMNLCKDSFRLE